MPVKSSSLILEKTENVFIKVFDTFINLKIGTKLDVGSMLSALASMLSTFASLSVCGVTAVL